VGSLLPPVVYRTTHRTTQLTTNGKTPLTDEGSPKAALNGAAKNNPSEVRTNHVPTTTTGGSSPGDRDIYVSIDSPRNGQRLEAEQKLFAELPALASHLGPAVTGLPLDVHRKFMADLLAEGRIFHDKDTNKVYAINGG
jgi:hypothetical protein